MTSRPSTTILGDGPLVGRFPVEGVAEGGLVGDFWAVAVVNVIRTTAASAAFIGARIVHSSIVVPAGGDFIGIVPRSRQDG